MLNANPELVVHTNDCPVQCPSCGFLNRTDRLTCILCYRGIAPYQWRSRLDAIDRLRTELIRADARRQARWRAVLSALVTVALFILAYTERHLWGL